MFASTSPVAWAPRVPTSQRASGGTASLPVFQLRRRANPADSNDFVVGPSSVRACAVAAKTTNIEVVETATDAKAESGTNIASGKERETSRDALDNATKVTDTVGDSGGADDDADNTPFAVEINVDRRPDGQFLDDLNNASSVKQWTALVKDRDMSRSATELGAALFALRRLQRNERQISKGTSRILNKWKALMKYNVKNMPSRSIANSVSALVALKHCDKVLMSSVAQTVQKRIRAKPTAFKLVELSQICWSCKMMAFRNVGLMKAVSQGIQAATPETINPTSLAVLLAFIPQLNFYDAKLMNFMLEKLLEMSEGLSVEECKSAFLGCARLQFLEAKDHFYRLQDTLRRQKKSRISRTDALAILLALLHLEALQPETTEALQSSLTEGEARWSDAELATLNAIIESMKVQGHSTELGLPAELLEEAAASAGRQAVRMSPLVAAVKEVMEKELGLPVRSIRSKQGWGIPIFVKDSYAVCVATPRQYMQNAPLQLDGQLTLLTRSLKAEGIVPVVVKCDTLDKELMWAGPNTEEHVKKQADYLRSCLPAEVFQT